MTKYVLREREIDLTGDGHGHHIPGTPNVYSHGWRPVKVAPHEVKVGDRMDRSGKTRVSKIAKQPNGDHMAQTKMKGARSPSVHVFETGKKHTVYRQIAQMNEVAREKGAALKPRSHRTIEGKVTLTPKAHSKGLDFGTKDPKTHRHILNVTHEERMKVYKENGLDSKHGDVSDEDLMEAIKKAQTPGERQSLRDEATARMKVLSLTLDAVDRADKDSARDKTRDYFAKFDKALGKSSMGRGVLRLRDRLLTDGSMDKMSLYGGKAGKFGKDVGMRVATATALTLMLGPIGGAVGLAFGTAAHEATMHVLENVVSHSGLHALLHKHAVDPAYEHGVKLVKKAKSTRAKRLMEKADSEATKAKKLAGKL